MNALKDLRVDPTSFAAFLETQIEIADAVKEVVEYYDSKTERAIMGAITVMYSLK